MSTDVRTFQSLLHEIGQTGGVPAGALDAPIRLASGVVKPFSEITHADVRAEQDDLAAQAVALAAETDFLDQLHRDGDLEGATALFRSHLLGFLDRGELAALNDTVINIMGADAGYLVTLLIDEGRLDELSDWIHSLTPAPGSDR